MSLEIKLFGTFSAETPTATLQFRSDKIRALFIYLLLANSQPVRRDTLATLLWPDETDKRARSNLRDALFRLRRTFGQADFAPNLVADRKAMQWIIGDDIDCDVVRWRGLLVMVAAHEHADLLTCAACAGWLEAAIELYRGELLPGFVLESAEPMMEWLYVEREQLQEQALTVLHQLSDIHLATDSAATALHYAHRQLALEAWRESALRQALQAYAQLNQWAQLETEYERFCQLLDVEFGLPPAPETHELYQSLIARQPHSPALDRHNLPAQLTPFVGRSAEIAAIQAAIDSRDFRLLTLTGGGGSGKTRLAIEVARENIGRFRDGVYLVELASINRASLLVPTICDAIGLTLLDTPSPQQQLIHHLRDRHLLLVIDNLEHLIDDSIDTLLALLKEAANLVLIVTSRQRLMVRAETIFDIDGLPLPDDDSAGDAVLLFEQQAKRVQKAFDLAETRAAVVTICQLLEGLPLGIELAAAQLLEQSADHIAQAIEHNLASVATRMRDIPARQRSLQAVFDYSWQLLDDIARQTLALCAVFQGGFTQEAAKAVIPALKPHILQRLINRSLLQRDVTGRYRMHPLVHHFSAAKLSNYPATIHNNHSRHYLQVAQQLAEQGKGMAFAKMSQRLQLEWGNCLTAWQFAVDSAKFDAVAASASVIRAVHHYRLLYREGFDLLHDNYDQLAAMPSLAGDECERVLGRIAAEQVAFVRYLDLDHAEAEKLIERAIDHAEQSAESNTRLWIAHTQLALNLFRNQYDDALTFAEMLVQGGREHDLRHHLTHGMAAIGFVRMRRGRFAEAAHQLAQAVTLARQQDDVLQLVNCLLHWGRANTHLQAWESAEAALNEALDLACTRATIQSETEVLESLGILYSQTGDYGRAIDCFAQRLAFGEAHGQPATIVQSQLNLGLEYWRVGMFDAAENHYNAILSQPKAAVHPLSYLLALINATLLLETQGRFAAAVEMGRRALAQPAAQRIPPYKAYALTNLGHALAGLGDYAQATIHYREAIALREAHGELTLAMESRAGLARVALALGEVGRASAEIDLILAHDDVTGTEQPLRILQTCHQVLSASNDSRAEAVAKRMTAMLTEQANRISDPEMRLSFLNSHPQLDSRFI